ncbi:MAG: RidA family protein [SAR324 cluster bacterium]|nr:RidA family protein [SAR324 cluster bacterium]MCZ6628812.1 RidA family protein [SAR324 cluster bacterium]MCZ6841939.1 RidA family protein [SAR324 cluster bacterium]
MAKTTYDLAGPIAKSGTFSGSVAFSNGVKVSGGEMLFVSGQLAKVDSELVGKGDIKAQTRQVLENIKKVLDQAGATFSDVVRVTVYITDMSHFRDIHDVRLQYFDKDNLPASTMVEVSGFVDEDALIEIEAVAVINP